MKILFHLSTLLLLLLFTACNNDNKSSAALDEAAEDMKEMVPEASTNADVQLADYNWLQKYLPAQVSGKELAKTNAELTNMLGYEISRAEATYGSFGMTTIAIADVSKAGTELGKIGAWVENDLDEVDNQSFQRTSKLDNTYRTLEKYDATDKTATVSVLVGGRYLITATSENDHQVEDLKAAIQSMELAQLASNQK